MKLTGCEHRAREEVARPIFPYLTVENRHVMRVLVQKRTRRTSRTGLILSEEHELFFYRGAIAQTCKSEDTRMRRNEAAYSGVGRCDTRQASLSETRYRLLLIVWCAVTMGTGHCTEVYRLIQAV